MLSAKLAGALIALIAALWSTPTWSQQNVEDFALDLVYQGLEAELAGDNQRRLQLLQQAIATDADCSLAYWHLGRVLVGKQWLDVREYQQQVAADPDYQHYRQLRLNLPHTVDADVTLARWCRKHNWDVEASFHWFQVVQLQPDHAEALDALQARWLDGQLLTQEEVIGLRRSRAEAKHALRNWKPRLRRLANDLLHSAQPQLSAAALQQLEQIVDPAVIAALQETMLGENEVLEFAALRALGGISHFDATQALVRIAVLSEYEPVRAAAIQQLMQRPIHDFFPFLLAGLETPLQSWFRIEYGPDGDVLYHHEINRERPESLERTVWNGRFDQIDLRNGVDTVVAGARAAVGFIPATTNDRVSRTKAILASSSAHRYAEFARRLELDVAEANAQSLQFNQRIHAVLQRTAPVDTGELGDSPELWWKWWQDYNEVYVGDEKKLYQRNWDEYSKFTYTPRVIRSPSCFARGTLVWTKTGLAAIETVREGDMVLSQNPESGELAFRPVLATTWRPPCTQIRLQINGQTIDSTLGHPFWLSGSGWRMAKLLQTRDLLHTLYGSQRVQQLERLPAGEAFNLIVGDFNNYFVGPQGLLVHDNTYRRPLQVVLPGMSQY